MKEKNHLLDDYFRKYRKLVIKNAYLFLKDYYEAEDICQETFIRLGENLDRVPPEKVKAWLIRVSERLALDYLRKGGKYEIELVNHQDETVIMEDTDLSSEMVRREEVRNKGHVLKKLKRERPLWYEVLVMSSLENMDNHMIGDLLGIRPSLVSKWKERARCWLNESYEKEYGYNEEGG